MRKFTVVTTTLTFFMLFAFAVAAFAADQTTCPVMGGTINKDLYVDYKGERIYFCCQACLPQFKKDPEKFIKKMKEMGQEPEKIPSEK